MNIDKRWLILVALAAGAAGGAVATLTVRRRHHRTVANRQHRHSIMSWEGEGGNLAPPPRASVLAAMEAKS